MQRQKGVTATEMDSVKSCIETILKPHFNSSANEVRKSRLGSIAIREAPKSKDHSLHLPT
jgi:hypothetical protein